MHVISQLVALLHSRYADSFIGDVVYKYSSLNQLLIIFQDPINDYSPNNCSTSNCTISINVTVLSVNSTAIEIVSPVNISMMYGSITKKVIS